MAAFTVTPSQVIESASAEVTTGVCGGTITQGMAIYIDTANDNVLKAADSDASALAATVAGIALNGGSAGQTIRYVRQDPALQLGAAAALAVGDVVYLAEEGSGALTKTFADLETGDYVTVIGVCTVAASTINMKIIAAGAAIA